MRTGYHYTSISNWERIKKEGLQPYEIQKQSITEAQGYVVYAIWVWLHQPKDLAHIGNIIYQMAMKNTTQAVLLKVQYNKSDVLSVDGREVKLLHDGTIGNLTYHENVVARLVLSNIPPKDIELIGQFDLLNAWQTINVFKEQYEGVKNGI